MADGLGNVEVILDMDHDSDTPLVLTLQTVGGPHDGIGVVWPLEKDEAYQFVGMLDEWAFAQRLHDRDTEEPT